MKAVIQRVHHSKVEVDSQIIGQIDKGLLIFLGAAKGDTTKEADYLVQKITQLRIFEDDQGKMNICAIDAKAHILVVSQFTLYGDCSKGRRPSFDKAAQPDIANELYEYFIEQLRRQGLKVETGEFGAMMNVSLVNYGPVTFILET